MLGIKSTFVVEDSRSHSVLLFQSVPQCVISPVGPTGVISPVGPTGVISPVGPTVCY